MVVASLQYLVLTSVRMSHEAQAVDMCQIEGPLGHVSLSSVTFCPVDAQLQARDWDA